MKKLIFVLPFLLAPTAFAETMISIDAGPGYVGYLGEYGMYCRISTDGLITYKYEASAQPTVYHQGDASFRQVALLNRLIAESRDAPTPADSYETGCGDLPDYEITVYPDDAAKRLLVHGDGRDMSPGSRSARRLARLAVRLCGMTPEIRKQNSEKIDLKRAR
jgi:hypothetical protein